MIVHVSADLDIPASTTWRLFGEEFGDVSKWSPGFSSSSLDGEVRQGAIRTVELKPGGALSGVITQELTVFDRGSRSLTYEMRSGMPKLLRGVSNAWTIDELQGERSKLRGEATFDLAWWAWPLTPVLRKKMQASLDGFAAEFAQHAGSNPS